MVNSTDNQRTRLLPEHQQASHRPAGAARAGSPGWFGARRVTTGPLDATQLNKTKRLGGTAPLSLFNKRDRTPKVPIVPNSSAPVTAVGVGLHTQTSSPVHSPVASAPNAGLENKPLGLAEGVRPHTAKVNDEEIEALAVLMDEIAAAGKDVSIDDKLSELAKASGIQNADALLGDAAFKSLSKEQKLDVISGLKGQDAQSILTKLAAQPIEDLTTLGILATRNIATGEFFKTAIAKSVPEGSPDAQRVAKLSIETAILYAKLTDPNDPRTDPQLREPKADGTRSTLNEFYDKLLGSMSKDSSSNLQRLAFITKFRQLDPNKADGAGTMALLTQIGWDADKIKQKLKLQVDDEGRVTGRPETIDEMIDGWVQKGVRSFEDLSSLLEGCNQNAANVIKRFSEFANGKRSRLQQTWHVMHQPVSLVAERLLTKVGVGFAQKTSAAQLLRENGRHQVGLARWNIAAHYLSQSGAPTMSRQSDKKLCTQEHVKEANETIGRNLRLAHQFCNLFDHPEFADFAAKVPVKLSDDSIPDELARHNVLSTCTDSEKRALIRAIALLKSAPTEQQAEALLMMTAPKSLKSPAIGVDGRHFWVPGDKDASHAQKLVALNTFGSQVVEPEDRAKQTCRDATKRLTELYERPGGAMIEHFETSFSSGKPWLQAPMDSELKDHFLPMAVFYASTSENCRRDISMAKVRALEGSVNVAGIGAGALGLGGSVGLTVGGKVQSDKKDAVRTEAWGSQRFLIWTNDQNSAVGVKAGALAQIKLPFLRASAKLAEASGETRWGTQKGHALSYNEDQRASFEDHIIKMVSRQELTAADLLGTAAIHEIAGTSKERTLAVETGVSVALGSTALPSSFVALGDESTQDGLLRLRATGRLAQRHQKAVTNYRGDRTNEVRQNNVAETTATASALLASSVTSPAQTALSAPAGLTHNSDALQLGNKHEGAPAATSAIRAAVSQPIISVSKSRVQNNSDNVRDITDTFGNYTPAGRIMILKTAHKNGNTLQEMLEPLALPSLRAILHDKADDGTQSQLLATARQWKPGDTINVTYRLSDAAIRRANLLKQRIKDAPPEGRERQQMLLDNLIDSEDSYIPLKLSIEPEVKIKDEWGGTFVFFKSATTSEVMFRESSALVGFPPPPAPVIQSPEQSPKQSPDLRGLDSLSDKSVYEPQQMGGGPSRLSQDIVEDTPPSPAEEASLMSPATPPTEQAAGSPSPIMDRFASSAGSVSDNDQSPERSSPRALVDELIPEEDQPDQVSPSSALRQPSEPNKDVETPQIPASHSSVNAEGADEQIGYDSDLETNRSGARAPIAMDTSRPITASPEGQNSSPRLAIPVAEMPEYRGDDDDFALASDRRPPGKPQISRFSLSFKRLEEASEGTRQAETNRDKKRRLEGQLEEGFLLSTARASARTARAAEAGGGAAQSLAPVITPVVPQPKRTETSKLTAEARRKMVEKLNPADRTKFLQEVNQATPNSALYFRGIRLAGKLEDLDRRLQELSARAPAAAGSPSNSDPATAPSTRLVARRLPTSNPAGFRASQQRREPRALTNTPTNVR